MTRRPAPGRDAQSPVPVRANRRVAPRIRAEDVPWIVTVRLGQGHSGRLVDISRTGMLLETNERLHPGHKRVMTLALEDNRSESIQAQVVRSHLVALSGDGKPIYQAAILFARELDPELLTPVRRLLEMDDAADAAPAPRADHLDGPFDALWATPRGPDMTRVTSLSETGCVVHLQVPGETDMPAAVTVIFTPFRRLLLTGRVVDARPDGGCVLRFEGLSPEHRRALRVELRSHRAPPANAHGRPTIDLTELHASNW